MAAGDTRTDSEATVVSHPTGAPERTARSNRASGVLPPGYRLGNTYEIEALLARGGMGAVYRARHLELGTPHAIKVILPDLAEDTHIVTLFQEEARKLRRLRSEAIVAYEGLFRDETDTRYLVMEFVDGPSLAHFIKRRPLTVEEVRALRDRCAAGLAAAHDKGIVHRDISPDNIILVDESVELAKIIDFGIAKSSDPSAATVVGDGFAGKYSYVSPEQLGMHGGKVDGRADIYSLGLVLVAAALGRPLSMGNSPVSVVDARRAVPDLSALPAALRAEIAPMLEPDPAKRPSTMRDLPGLAYELPHSTTRRHSTAPPAAPPRAASGRRWLWIAVAAVAAVAVGLVSFGLFLSGSHTPAPGVVAVPAPTPPATASPTTASPGPVVQSAPASAATPPPPLTSTPSAPTPNPTVQVAPAAGAVSPAPPSALPPPSKPAATSAVVPKPAHPTAATLEAPPQKKPVDPRCESILERSQLGEAPNDDERAYLRTNCR